MEEVRRHHHFIKVMVGEFARRLVSALSPSLPLSCLPVGAPQTLTYGVLVWLQKLWHLIWRRLIMDDALINIYMHLFLANHMLCSLIMDDAFGVIYLWSLF